MKFPVSITVNGSRESQRGRAAAAARPLPARDAGPHRHQRRLRHQPVRRLHRAHRRPGGEVLHRARRPGRRRERDHDRRAGQGRQAPSPAGGVLGEARPAVRLLHARDDPDRLRPPEAEPQAQRGRDPPRPRRQPLPLHRATRTSCALPARRRRAKDGRRPWHPASSAPGSSAARTRGSSPARASSPTTSCCPGMVAPGGRALALRPRPHQEDRHHAGAERCPACSASSPGQEMKDAGFGGIPCAWVVPNSDTKTPAYPAHRHRHRALRGQRGGDRGGGRPLRGPRRRRRGRGGLRAAAGGGRRLEGRAEGRARSSTPTCPATSASTGR